MNTHDGVERADRVHLVGVPFNSAGRNDGVARAPMALRKAGLVQRLRDVVVHIDDRGDVSVGPASAERDLESGLIAPLALVRMIEMVRAEVGASLAAGGFPVVIGGDCPVLLGCLGASGVDAMPGLLFIDGHEDAWPPARSTTGEAADMELGLALGRTVAGLPPSVVDHIPRLDTRRVVVLGARDAAELADAGVASLRGTVPVVPPEELGAAEQIVSAAVRRIEGIGGWWLHVDLDVLSTVSLAAVDYPLPGGIDWRQLTALTRQALSSPGVVGWDITIYNPDLDPDGEQARLIVRYVVDSIGN